MTNNCLVAMAIALGVPLLSVLSVLATHWLTHRLRNQWYDARQRLWSWLYMLAGGNSIHFTARLGPTHTFTSLFRWRGPWQPNALRAEHLFRKSLDDVIVGVDSDGNAVPASTMPDFVPPPYATTAYTLRPTKV